MALVGWTTQDIAALKTAIATGALTVSYEGPPKRLITYRSQTEMLQALALAMKEVNNTPNYGFAATQKGV